MAASAPAIATAAGMAVPALNLAAVNGFDQTLLSA